MSHEHAETAAPAKDYSLLIQAIGVIVAVYILTLISGWPQRLTAFANESHPPATEVTEGGHDAPAGEHEAHSSHKPPPPAWPWIAPFALLLGAIAIFPLTPGLAHWWENNLHKLYVAGALALVTLLYYTFGHPYPIERHFAGHGLVEPMRGVNIDIPLVLLMNCVLGEYVPFIVLLFSLYTIAGGLRITGDLNASPATNTKIMAVGALLASFVGTTGAAMILIRLLLETNRERKHVAHTVVFFIFIVCNAGGLLLPLGDPPLFLGYLLGVDFLWTLKLVLAWLFVNGSLLAIYYYADSKWYRPRELSEDVRRDQVETKPIQISGTVNILWLAGVVFCVALLDPTKTFPGTAWHPPIYLREVLQLALVALSLWTTPMQLRIDNGFNFGAILEVAALFIGIFVTMQPALQILSAHGAALGLDTPTKYFWATGMLSAVLDNAPTYAVFFGAAESLPHQPMYGRVLADGLPAENLLAAVSLGAVLMGAITYIGNGPNFMVRTIAEGSCVKMPSFFGYMQYSLLVLIPLFIVLNGLMAITGFWVAW